MLAALFQIERDEKRMDLARKNYWPDLTLGASLINVEPRADLPGRLNPPVQNGKNVYSFTVGLNINEAGGPATDRKGRKAH